MADSACLLGEILPNVVRLFEARKNLARVESEQRSIAEIARKAGMSPAHFIRQFRSTFGETPHQVAVEARLARATELLRNTALPVTEICYECGYESLGSFSYLFRRELGVSPRKFRQQRRRYWPVNITFLHRFVPLCLLDGFR